MMNNNGVRYKPAKKEVRSVQIDDLIVGTLFKWEDAFGIVALDHIHRYLRRGILFSNGGFLTGDTQVTALSLGDQVVVTQGGEACE
jgi:hypothetical protein